MKSSLAFIAAAIVQLAAAVQQIAPVGGQYIVNHCTKDLNFQNVPATAADAQNPQATSGTLAANGGTFFAHWVMLDASVNGGWSYKVAANNDWSNIYQFEYTWTDSQVWTDLSFVNGQESTLPSWALSCDGVAMSSGAYLYATDDARGMQKPVSPDSTVTLAFCPELEKGADPAATTTNPPATVTPAPEFAAVAPTTTTTPKPDQAAAVVITTLATTTSAPAPIKNSAQAAQVNPNGEIDEVAVHTEYAFEYVTAVVTETAPAAPTPQPKHRRHEHRHPHGHRF